MTTYRDENDLDRKMAKQFLDLIFPENGVKGFIAVSFRVPEEAVGNRPGRLWNDYYIPRHCKPDNRFGWADTTFAINEKEELLDHVEERMACDEVKVMISPALFKRPATRKLTDVNHISVLHLDYDVPEGSEGMPPALIRSLRRCRAILVESGRAGNLHVYIPVKGLNVETHYRLSYALRNKFGADDKIRPNDLLTLPGTFNFKDADHPAEVRLLDLDNGKPRPMSGEDEVIERLGLADWINTVPAYQGPVDFSPDEVDLSGVGPRLLRRLKRDAENGQDIDRSAANYRIVKMCKENGLTPGQTYAFMLTLDEDLIKFGDDVAKLAEDVSRSWDKDTGRRNTSTPPPNSITRTTPISARELEIGEDEIEVVEDEPKQIFYRLGELISEVDAMPPPSYLVEGIIPQGDYGVMSADPKTGKTFLVMDLALSVASGTAWVGRFNVTNTGPVLIFVGEGGKRKIVRRMRAIARHKGIPDHQLLALPIDVSERAPKLMDQEHVDELTEKVLNLRPKLVIIDPLYLAMSGANAASLSEMGSLLEKAQHVAQSVGASLIISHHNKKGSGDTHTEDTPMMRTSGVGINEWGRFLISIVKQRRRIIDYDLGKSEVMSKWYVIGDEVPDSEYIFTMHVHTDDRNDLSSKMHYSIVSESEEKALRNRDWEKDESWRLMVKIHGALVDGYPGGVMQKELLLDLKLKVPASPGTKKALDKLESLGCITREKQAERRGQPLLVTPTKVPLPTSEAQVRELTETMEIDFSEELEPDELGYEMDE